MSVTLDRTRSVAYRNNWLKHALANFTANPFDDELARDFWTSGNLWDPQDVVRWRWFKLCFVYIMCGFAQITVPLFVIGIPIIFFKGHAWIWLLISTGVGTLGAILSAPLATTRVYLRIVRTSKRERKNLDRFVSTVGNAIALLPLYVGVAICAYLIIFGLDAR